MTTLILILMFIGIWWLGLAVCCLSDKMQTRLHRKYGWFAKEETLRQQIENEECAVESFEATIPENPSSKFKVVLAYLSLGFATFIFLPMIVIGMSADRQKSKHPSNQKF